MGFDETTGVVRTPVPRSAGGPRVACLTILAGRNTGKAYRLGDGDCVLGRSLEANICVDDPGVSRRHARVRRVANQFVVEDLGSTNGTRCNGKAVKHHVLQDGDKLQVGSTTIVRFSLQDAIEEEFQRRQYESVTRDPLTGCFNKRYLIERLPGELAFAQRHRRSLSLSLLDLDHFKKVNDTYGHPAGDAVLRAVVNLIVANIRKEDVLARYGGEEFALLMRETPADAAFLMVERIRRVLESKPLDIDGNRIAVTVSAGVATSPAGALASAEEFVRLADRYLYRAKERGRNRTEGEAVV